MIQITPLEKALIFSYLHSRQLLKNLEVAHHEMKVLNDPRAGKLQFNLERLTNVTRKAFSNLEKNIENKDLLNEDLENIMDENWGVTNMIIEPFKPKPFKVALFTTFKNKSWRVK